MNNSKLNTKKKEKFPAEVVEIFSTLKNDGIKLSMLKEATLVKKLTNQYNLKPTVIKKQTKKSLPHVYNLIKLGEMTPKMKAFILSGKIKGTDALKILGKTSNEAEFIKEAQTEAITKIDKRRKENKTRVAEKPKVENENKEKIKELIINFLGKSNPKVKSVDTLVNAIVNN